MFKLAVVGGPAKGKSYTLKDSGETSIGRIEGNDVVLNSTKVSKRHCVLVVSNKDVQLKDAGSSNGTFVNGVLTKLKVLKPGDRVSVGEFVFELVKVEQKARPLANNVIPMNPGMPMGMPTGTGNTNIGLSPGSAGVPNNAAPPQNLQEKIKYLFEQNVINFVYNLNEKHEWRAMITAMFVILTLACVCLSVYPVLDRVNGKLSEEAGGRALVLARQVVDRNAAYIFEKQDSKVDVTYVEREPGVVSAYIIDMDGRILAPGRKLNQNITESVEAVFANASRDAFMKNDALDKRVRLVGGDIVGAAVPLKIFSAAAGKNVTVAVSIVFFDRSNIIFDSGTEALAYIQALILSAIFAVVVFFSMYRLTLRPLTYLNDQIDQVLKGNGSQVEKKFKMEEINPLIDVVNSALQRASQAGPGAMAAGGGGDDAFDLVKFVGARMSGSGVIVFNGDKRITLMTPFMEEITGIRADSAIGQDVGSVARDAAFGAFIEDLFARAPFAPGDPIGEDFEFSGTAYRMEVLATGAPGAVKHYVITATRPA